MKANIINGETIGENEMQCVLCFVSGIRNVLSEMKRFSYYSVTIKNSE